MKKSKSNEPTNPERIIRNFLKYFLLLTENIYKNCYYNKEINSHYLNATYQGLFDNPQSKYTILRNL